MAELREIRDYLADPSKYLAVGAAAPKGVLLVGPPGTGKTLLAKAVAGEADAAFFSLSGSDFVESLVGVGAARVRDLFRKARKVAPAIIFIDELDAAGRKRGAGIGQGNDEREQTLNQILVEMDGFAGDGGLVVMGATNRPDILDPALLRPGRFDRQVVIDTPDVHGRLEILRLHGGKRPLAPDASLEEVARQTPGFSGAELANVINEAALLSVRDGRAQIDQATLEEAIDRVVAGPAKHHILTEQERWLIAIHEASHAVVTEALGHTTSTRKLSIVARGRQLGTAAHMLSDRDQLIMSEPDLQSQLIVITAGLAGERIAFGHTSTSVNDDLHAATALARSMVTSFGMSEALGLVTIGEKSGEVFLGASLQDLGSVGPETLNLIDNEVERLVGDAEARAAVDPRPQLEHRRGDGGGAARAGDALGRGARRGALDRPGGTRSTSCARCAAPRRRATRVRERAPATAHARGVAATALGGEPAQTGRARLPAAALAGARRRAASRSCFSTTGLADAARHAVVSAFAGHPVSTKPHAGGVLLLGQEQEIPGRGDPHGQRTPRASAARPPNSSQAPARRRRSTSAPGAWTPRPTRSPRRTSARTTSSSRARRARPKAAGCPRASELLGAAERVKLESTIHDSQLTATIDLDPSRGPERRTRDELDAGHDRSRVGRRRVRGRQRRGDRQPPPGPGQPVPLPGQPAARIAAVRDRLQQQQPGRLRRLRAASRNRENFRCAFNKTPGRASTTRES